MAYEIGTASDYKNLLVKLKDFATRANIVSAAVANPGNTGDGTCSQPTADDDAPTETWTLTATSATNFTVVGSVSGPQSNATVGSAYDDIVQFTITAGGTPFISGDSFTFTVSLELGTEKWTVNEYSTDVDPGQDELYLQGSGISANDEIFVGIRTEYNATEPYYIWILNGMTGYEVTLDFYSQLGCIPTGRMPFMLLDNGTLKYWFIGNGRRLMGVIRVGTIYSPFYLGFPLIYGQPNTFPYPLCIGGASAYTGTSSEKKWSSTNIKHRGWPEGYIPNGGAYNTIAALQVLSGAWSAFGNYFGNDDADLSYGNCMWPYTYSFGGSVFYGGYPNELIEAGDPLLDGSFELFPLVLSQEFPSKNIIGEMDGAFAVLGVGVVAEDEITVSGVVHKVFQNTYHTEAQNYFALKLE